jgi:uncharacterized protein
MPNLGRINSTNPSERILSLDFLRGIAILGILIINIESFSYPDPWSPTKYGFFRHVDHNVRFWVYFLTQGKFFSMLTLLFGVGFYIFLQRLENKGVGLKAIDIYSRRLLCLFLFGVIHAYIFWDGDVLYHYAVCGFLLFPFRPFTVRQLALVLLIPIGILLFNSYETSTVNQRKFEAYSEAIKKPDEKKSEQEREAVREWEDLTAIEEPDTSLVQMVRPTIYQNWLANAEHTKVHKGTILYTGIFFRTLIMMILGILLYKLDIFRNYNSVRYYWPSTITLMLVALTINYFRYYHWSFAYFDPVKNVWQGWLFTFSKETLGLAYILFFNGLYQIFFKKSIYKAITLVGKMALSNYILQSIVCGAIFYGYGLGQYNHFSRSNLILIVVGIWLFQILISCIWMKNFSIGPLEWVWRKLTYRSFD